MATAWLLGHLSHEWGLVTEQFVAVILWSLDLCTTVQSCEIARRNVVTSVGRNHSTANGEMSRKARLFEARSWQVPDLMPATDSGPDHSQRRRIAGAESVNLDSQLLASNKRACSLVGLRLLASRSLSNYNSRLSLAASTVVSIINQFTSPKYDDDASCRFSGRRKEGRLYIPELLFTFTYANLHRISIATTLLFSSRGFLLSQNQEWNW